MSREDRSRMERITLGVSVQRSGTMTRLRTMVGAAMLAGTLGIGLSAAAQTDGQTQDSAQPASGASAAPSTPAAVAPAIPVSTGTSTIQGVVKAGGVPLPGVAVTAISGDGKKYATTTDINGAFRMDVPAGTYQVKTQLMGFASLTKQVVATAADAVVAQQLEFTTDLASRMPDQTPANASTTASNEPALTAPGAGNATKPAGANAGAAPAGRPSGTATTASNRTPGVGVR